MNIIQSRHFLVHHLITRCKNQFSRKYLLKSGLDIKLNYFYNTSIFLMLVFLFFSCSPQSKESYMKKYEGFMIDLNEKCETYRDKDWEKAEKKFQKFNSDWYDIFKDEFTMKEELIILKYKFQYNLLKIKANSKIFFDSDVKEHYNELKEQIKFYSDNDMKDELKELLNQAKEIGDSATQSVEQIFKELDIDLDKLRNTTPE